MALATADDVNKTMLSAAGRALTDAERANLAAGDLLDEATDLVVGYLYPNPVPTPTPDTIVRVVALMATAVINRPSSMVPNAQSLNASAYGVTFEAGTTNPGPYLTQALKLRLAPFRGNNGMSVVGLEGESCGIDGGLFGVGYCDDDYDDDLYCGS